MWFYVCYRFIDGVSGIKEKVMSLIWGMKRVREDVKGVVYLIWIFKDELDVGKRRRKGILSRGNSSVKSSGLKVLVYFRKVR